MRQFELFAIITPTYSTHDRCCMPSEWLAVSLHLIPQQASQETKHGQIINVCVQSKTTLLTDILSSILYGTELFRKDFSSLVRISMSVMSLKKMLVKQFRK